MTQNTHTRPRWIEAAAKDYCIANQITAFTYRDRVVMMAIHDLYRVYRGTFIPNVTDEVKLKNVAEALGKSDLFATRRVRIIDDNIPFRQFTYKGDQTYSRFHTSIIRRSEKWYERTETEDETDTGTI